MDSLLWFWWQKILPLSLRARSGGKIFCHQNQRRESMKDFRTLTQAKQFFLKIRKLKLPYFAKNQLERAGLSIVTNLAEGAARYTSKERTRFYQIAKGSYRECAEILEVYNQKHLTEKTC